jgi:hypothetical protein
MKTLNIIILVFILFSNILLVGCSTSIFNSDKSYYQTVKCVNGRPEVHIYYGKEFQYMKIEPLEQQNSKNECSGGLKNSGNQDN